MQNRILKKYNKISTFKNNFTLPKIITHVPIFFFFFKISRIIHFVLIEDCNDYSTTIQLLCVYQLIDITRQRIWLLQPSVKIIIIHPFAYVSYLKKKIKTLIFTTNIDYFCLCVFKGFVFLLLLRHICIRFNINILYLERILRPNLIHCKNK